MRFSIYGYFGAMAGRAAPQVLVVYILPWLVLLAGGTTLVIGLRNLHGAQASRSWPQAQGIVVSSTPEASVNAVGALLTRSGGTTYRTYLDYIYRVEGEEYAGNRVTFGEMGTNTPDRARRLLQKYPPGQRVKVYYNQESPGDAVLEPGPELQTYILPVVGTLVTLAGLAMTIGLPIAARKAAW